MAVCAFIPTYVRHYFLLQRPILQTKLLDYETMVDPDKYKALSRRLIRIKFLSSETFALGFYLINCGACLIPFIYYFTITDFSLMALNLTNPADSYLVNISLIQVSISLVFLLSYGPRSPRDNFQIMNQFYMITALTMLNCVTTVTGLVSESTRINYICFTISSVFSFLAVMIDLAIPLQFLIKRNHRYKVDKTHSTSTKSCTCKLSTSNPIRLFRLNSMEDSRKESSIYPVSSGITLESNTPPIRLMSVQKSISKIMADPVLHAEFCKYLAREFALENLLFIESVKRYKECLRKSPTNATMEPLADKIMSEFILPNSVNEVNLSKKTVVELNIHLNTTLLGLLDIEKALTIFDEAAEQIEHMLVSNHLRRFQASQAFQNAALIREP
ncbi:hypothetical protein BSLG_002336 [Batrachochytrium salamandrivorans]|nr:hypothetical protein BSLG_002336 [Batrachochytrium salamandrivorans]